MKTRLGVCAAAVLIGLGGCGDFGPAGSAFLPLVFDGRYEVKSDDESVRMRFVVEGNAVARYEDDGAEKTVTGSTPISQAAGRINFVGFSGFMRPFSDRAMEQWSVTFSGDERAPWEYTGTLVLRLSASNQEFGRFPAKLVRIGN